jgi:hypothetical protein
MGSSALSVGSVGSFDDSSADEDATTTAEDTNGDVDENDGESSSGDDAASSTTMGATDEGSSGALDDGSSSDDGSAEECPTEMTCPMGTVIGEVSGDEASRPIAFEGAESMWVSFQVTEDNDAVTGEAVSFTATLTSPDGFDFDLYVYRGPEGAGSGCGGELEQSTSAGANDVVHMSWGESGVANGGDDRAWVAAEIVAKNGMCDPLAPWSLTIDGDT